MAEKSKKGIIIAAIVGGIGCISIIGIMLLVVLVFFAPVMIGASNKAKEGAVKANLYAAASTVVTLLAVDELPAQQAVDRAVEKLNTSYGDARSPFDPSIPAFGTEPAPGVVVLKAIGKNTVEINAYNKHNEVIATKTIEPPQ